MFAIRPVARAASRLVGGKTEPPFDIASLFENDEQGIWLDPNDLSTMFQDVGCTVPVTVGQTVGYIYDKARPSVKRRNLLTDTDLSNITAFRLRGGAISLDNINGKNVLRMGNNAQTLDSYAYMDAPLELGKEYVLSITIETVNNDILDTATLSDFAFVIEGSIPAASRYIVEQLSTSKARISCRFTATKASTPAGVVKYKYTTDKDLYVYDYQIEAGEEATEYQAIDAANNWIGKFGAYQADTAKQPILRFNEVTNKYYLEFDGIDDFLVITYRVFQVNQKCTVLTHVKTINTDTKTLIASGSAGYLRTTATIFSQYDSANPPSIRQVNQDILEAYFDVSIGTRLKTSMEEFQSDLRITPFSGASVFIATFSDVHTALRAKIHLYSLIMRSDILDSETVDKVKKVM